MTERCGDEQEPPDSPRDWWEGWAAFIAFVVAVYTIPIGIIFALIAVIG